MALHASDLQAQWTQVGNTANGLINTMLPYNNLLFLAGGFTNYNGTSSYRSATFNGTTFGYHGTILGGGTGIMDLVVHNGSLFAGGGFSQGASGPNGVGIWTGGSWGSGYNVGNPINVNALASFGGKLIVGGAFLTPGPRIAQHDGTSYAPMGSGFDGTVNDLKIYNNELYACGSMVNSGSTPLANIARWTGSAWVSVGTGLNGFVREMEVWNGSLYVIGSFTTAGGVPAASVARWDGSNWTAVGGGIPLAFGESVNTLLATSSGLLVGGRFSNAGGVPAGCVALWNGSTWSSAGSFTTSELVTALGIYQGQVYLATYETTNTPTGRLYRTSSVGIGEQNFAADITAFPNPFSHTLRLGGDLTAIRSITMHDIAGRDVPVQRMANDLHTRSLAQGVYHLVLLGDNGRRTLRVVKE